MLTNLKYSYLNEVDSVFKSELILSLVASDEDTQLEWQKNARLFENVSFLKLT